MNDRAADARADGSGPLLRATVALFVVGFFLWLGFSWSGYAKSHASASECWHKGARNFIELTLVGEDRANLACASDVVVDGLRCEFPARRAPDSPPPAATVVDDAHRLRPYNTVGGQLLLGAALWSSPSLEAGLPAGRFSVWCDFEVKGAVRAVQLRWVAGGTFTPVDKSVAVGILRDCSISQ